MANIRFLFDNLYSALTTVLTASSAISALPADASQNEDRSFVWRSATNTTVQTLDIDLGSVKAVAAVALANVKVIGSGVVELYQRGDAASPGSATLVATLPAQNTYTRTTFAFFASQNHRHWQLKWTNPTSASDYAELGFGFLGAYLEPAVNVLVPLDTDWMDPSIGTPSVDGQKTFSERTKFFGGAWQFDTVNETQYGQLQAFFSAIGVSRSHFVVLDTALPWTSWYARLIGQLRNKFGVLAGQYSPAIAWEENR